MQIHLPTFFLPALFRLKGTFGQHLIEAIAASC